MIPNNPTQGNLNTWATLLRWAQSVYKALDNAISFGQGSGQAMSGVFNEFTTDNIQCKILYIGASGSGAPLFWSADNVGQPFNHGLLRQPIGFIPIYKSKTCDIYSTATPTKDVITLATTDDSATTIVMVF